MDMPPLQHRTRNIGLIGIPGPQALQGGILVPERPEKLEWKFRPIEWLQSQVRYGFFNFNGVHLRGNLFTSSLADTAARQRVFDNIVLNRQRALSKIAYRCIASFTTPDCSNVSAECGNALPVKEIAYSGFHINEIPALPVHKTTIALSLPT